MAWGDKRVTKEELKEAGLDLDVVSGMKTTLDGMDDKIKNAVTEATKGNSDTLAELKTQLASIAMKLQTPTSQQGQNRGDSSDENRQREEEPDWLLDPEKAATKLVDSKISGAVGLVAQMKADMNYSAFKATNPRAFAKYEKDIKEIWDKEPLQSRLNPKLIENVYKIVIADHVDEIAKQGETFFIEPSTSGQPHTNLREGKKAEEILTKDEMELCTRWGIKPEDYLKEKDVPNSTATVTTYA